MHFTDSNMSKIVTVRNFYSSTSHDKGQIIHNSVYNETELLDLVKEALGYGFDVQIKQTGMNDGHILLWYSTNGFKQR